MGSRSYNCYNANVQPNSSTNEGPPGYPPFPQHGASPGGPPPNDGMGPYYPPPYPAFPAPNHGGSISPPVPPRPNSGLLPMIQYKVRQTVRVRISADTWVVGVIVGFVHLASLITGRKYRVEFDSIDGQRETGDFFHEDMVPYQPRMGPYRQGG